MKIATLFSGIGSPEQAAMRVYDQVEHIFACECDKFARQSFKAIYEIEDKHFHADIKDMDGKQYKDKVDVLIGGSPCQSFSIAGMRGGTDDERGQLIYQYVRIVEEVKAPVIVYENVKGMLSIGGGRTIKEFVEALREIGYYCHYEVLNTKDYGVPQNRERVYIVGFLDVDTYYNFEFAPKIKLEKRLKDILEDGVDEKYYLSDKMVEYVTTKAHLHQSANQIQKGDVSRCLNACDYKSTPCIKVAGMLDVKGNDQIRRVYGTDETAPCLQTMQGGNREPKILDLTNDFSESKTREYTEFAPCLRSERAGLAVAEFGYRIRKLTPLECWRLQDFPDEAFYKAKEAGVSNSQLYKQTGNSMSVNILEMIFKQIEIAKQGQSNSLFRSII